MMPELPEVETVRRSLAPFLGASIVLSPSANRDSDARLLPISQVLTAERLLSLRRGVYLYLHLDDEKIWWSIR
jgi:formamidopyrimidine-DNA glycosylase